MSLPTIVWRVIVLHPYGQIQETATGSRLTGCRTFTARLANAGATLGLSVVFRGFGAGFINLDWFAFHA